MHIVYFPPISTKFINLPQFSFDLRFLLNLRIFAATLFGP